MTDRYERRCRLVRVVDGDTLDVVADLGFGLTFAQRVRLFGVDTAELNSTEPPDRVKGKLAKDFAEAWGTSKAYDAEDWAWPLIIRTIKDRRDKYGRLLARIWADDGSELGQALLDVGLARIYIP